MAGAKSAHNEDAEGVLDSWEDDLDTTSEVVRVTDRNDDLNREATNEDDEEDSESPSTTDDEDSNDSDKAHDDAEEDEDYSSQVLSGYRKLLSRRVDLVGDYAGNELFIIDGDSMLLRCFSDHRLDFNTGFQLLHAVYNVESFLHQLVRRKCNFHIVFFSNNRSLCVPREASGPNTAKYLLARAVIIRHLRTNLRASHPTLAVHEFPSYTSTAFVQYLALHSPYFIMAHDGAESAHRQAKHVNDAHTQTESLLNPNRAALREMVLFFIERGLNVALCNELEFRDTKAMAMVLESRHRSQDKARTRDLLTSSYANEGYDALKTELEKLRAFAPHLTERQQLAVIATGRLLKSKVATVSTELASQLTHPFLVHQAMLAHIPLSARRFPKASNSPDVQDFMRAVALSAEAILRDQAWQEGVTFEGTTDLADFLDGRLFFQVCTNCPQRGKEVERTLRELLASLEHLSNLKIGEDDAQIEAKPNGNYPTPERATELSVMPFSNPVFDPHLASIRLHVDEHAVGERTASSHRIFREVTHWHNAKKPLIHRGPPSAQTEKQAFWAAKRNQMFMAEMQKYAASLTNAVGRSLEPETIIVGASKPSRSIKLQEDVPDSDSTESSVSGPKSKHVPKKGGKKAQQTTGKKAILESIAATKAKKDESASDKIVAAWHTVCKGFEVENDPRSKYAKAQSYLASLPSAARNVVAAECQSYMLSCLVQYWTSLCRGKQKDRSVEVAALIWDTCRNVLKSDGLTKEISTHVHDTITRLGLPPTSTASTHSLPSRKPGFTFATPREADDVSIGLDQKEFQLKYCGPYLERSFDSRPDHRVDFLPDAWQRKVLDAIDAEKSCFAVAPTSAGKTFISFYAMRKVLEADDDGVLVYVAPTKALVNQIAAEIQARYSKKFKYGGKSVWAIHTRDYRINNPTGCQVLVTVPHVLQIMLLAPTNANSWSSRVKRIIFDEVHSIGQAEDGVIWEQLLLLAPCPIIALSATVGNPEEFSDWLTTTQKAIGVELVTVQHPHRYSDLRKYYYVPPQKFAFQGLPDNRAFGTLGLEHAVGLNRVHPIAALVDRSRGIPEDLALEPRDCLELYNALTKHATDRYPVSFELDPKNAVPEVARKVDILNWERRLKTLLQVWIEDGASPYAQLVKTLERDFRNEDREPLQMTRPESELKSAVSASSSDELLNWTLSLLCRLHEQNALPAILFNYDRHACEKITRAIMEQLHAAESKQVKSGMKWEKKLERWEDWKKIQEKAASRGAKAAKKKAGNKAEDPEDNEKTSKSDKTRDVAETDASSWHSFNPEDPIDGYHFADHAKVLPSEMEVYVRQLKRREVQQWLIDALKRGIGIHHAGMNRKYRQVVEILFRKGFLGVVVATGTLALGINMPCKTVVFSGDSVFLTALNYRQCAGRAGRRGFDLLGNIVFQDVSREKVCRLISSRLPDLNGHFPITTTLVLRLFTLLHESKNAKYAVSSINALLSQPRLYMGGPSFKDQTMHHLRFSIEYLRRQHLLGANGAPLNFAGLVSHLYFTENSSFAFHALMKEGFFHQLCVKVDKDEKSTLETLMLVMAHLFNRIYCRQADEEYREAVVKPSSSIVFLPPLPKKGADILREHNQQTLDVYRTYVETFVDQHITTDDRVLPLSGMNVGADSVEGAEIMHSLPPAKTRSAFVSLSGWTDEYKSCSDLCQTTREGVFLEEAVIPQVGVYPDDTDQPLNAYLLDFFKHGDIHTIEKANNIRRSDIWFLLNDFSLVLATIIASLLGFMKLKEGTDMDMLDVMGHVDAHEEAEDEQAAVSDEQSESGPSVADSAISIPERMPAANKKKAKNAESWEDLADEEDAIARAEDRKTKAASAPEVVESGAWAGDEGAQGLRMVLKAFTKLHAEFNVKFRAMWA